MRDGDLERVVRVKARLGELDLLVDVAAFAKEHRVTLDEVLSSRKTKAVVAARHAFLFSLHRRGLSWPEIGKLWEKNYSSIKHLRRSEPKPNPRAMREAIENFVAVQETLGEPISAKWGEAYERLKASLRNA